MTFKNNRAPLLSIIKLYASFHHHMWIQTGVTVRKRLSWVVNSVTLTLTFCMDVTFVIGNNSWKFHDDAMMGTWWKRCDGRTDRQRDWTSHIAAWSQLKTIGHLFYTHSSFMHHFIAIGEFTFELQSGNAQIGSNWRFFASCDLEILRMTLKTNRAPLLYPFKLYASYHSHWWI